MQMKLSVVVSLVASSLLAAALVVGCSGAGPAGESTSSSSGAPSGSSSGAGEQGDAGAEAADAATDAKPAATPELVPGPDSPGSTCDAFCRSKGTVCAASCKGADGKLVAGRITERVSLATPKYETRDVATCAEPHKSSATAVSFGAECCCLVTPSQTVIEELATARTCDDICGDKGLRCEGRGSIEFTRADGTKCSTTLACNESRPPTATCAQKPSVGATQTCTCR